MSNIERIYLLDRIHHLIRRKGTGGPKELAIKLSVSERTIYNLLNMLRDLGVEIFYSTESNSYCYKTEVTFNFLPVISKETVKGGNNRSIFITLQSSFSEKDYYCSKLG